ncbi:MAG: hypothetical protein V7637_5961 [Mycobacteriales bacterium]|jgi:hypothetical protein
MPHPAVRVDTVTITESTDFDALVLAALDGAGGSYRGDCAPLDWVNRAYRELGGTPYAGRLARAVAGCLTAADPGIRSQALIFVRSEPRAAGADRVLDLLAGDRRLFAGVPDPWHPGVDLEWQLLAALGGHLDAGDPRALRLAEAEVLRPGHAAPLIAALTAAEPDLVTEQADAIVRGTPAAGLTILIALQEAGRDIVALGRRLAPLCRADPRFTIDAARFIDDPAARDAILAAFHAAVDA